MNRLYEIRDEYLAIIDKIDEQGGEVTEEQDRALEAVEGDLQAKIESIARLRANLHSHVEAMRVERTRLSEKIKSEEATIDWLDGYVTRTMEAIGIKRIEGQIFKVRLQANPPKCLIFDEAKIPKEFKQEIVEVRIDKSGILKSLKAGEKVPGAGMVQGVGVRYSV